MLAYFQQHCRRTGTDHFQPGVDTMGKLFHKIKKRVRKEDRNSTYNPDAPILVVDDDPIIHKVMAKHLRGWKTRSAVSGQEALELLEKENFVIVITGLRMDGIDGMELLRRIKDKYNHRVQVIVIADSNDLDDIVDALDGGASYFLLKPLKKEVLMEVLQHTVSRIDRWNRSLNMLMTRKRNGILRKSYA